MKQIALAALAAAFAAAGCAQGGPHGGPHHGAGMDRYDQQMASMQTMHRRMAEAKTPEERRALMDEHMKAMQGGVRMMCDMGAAPESTRRCTDMRDMTMRMMMDREPAPAPVRP